MNELKELIGSRISETLSLWNSRKGRISAVDSGLSNFLPCLTLNDFRSLRALRNKFIEQTQTKFTLPRAPSIRPRAPYEKRVRIIEAGPFSFRLPCTEAEYQVEYTLASFLLRVGP